MKSDCKDLISNFKDGYSNYSETLSRMINQFDKNSTQNKQELITLKKKLEFNIENCHPIDQDFLDIKTCLTKAIRLCKNCCKALINDENKEFFKDSLALEGQDLFGRACCDKYNEIANLSLFVTELVSVITLNMDIIEEDDGTFSFGSLKNVSEKKAETKRNAVQKLLDQATVEIEKSRELYAKLSDRFKEIMEERKILSERISKVETEIACNQIVFDKLSKIKQERDAEYIQINNELADMKSNYKRYDLSYNKLTELRDKKDKLKNNLNENKKELSEIEDARKECVNGYKKGLKLIGNAFDSMFCKTVNYFSKLFGFGEVAKTQKNKKLDALKDRESILEADGDKLSKKYSKVKTSFKNEDNECNKLTITYENSYDKVEAKVRLFLEKIHFDLKLFENMK